MEQSNIEHPSQTHFTSDQWVQENLRIEQRLKEEEISNDVFSMLSACLSNGTFAGEIKRIQIQDNQDTFNRDLEMEDLLMEIRGIRKESQDLLERKKQLSSDKRTTNYLKRGNTKFLNKINEFKSFQGQNFELIEEERLSLEENLEQAAKLFGKKKQHENLQPKIQKKQFRSMMELSEGQGESIKHGSTDEEDFSANLEQSMGATQIDQNSFIQKEKQKEQDKQNPLRQMLSKVSERPDEESKIVNRKLSSLLRDNQNNEEEQEYYNNDHINVNESESIIINNKDLAVFLSPNIQESQIQNKSILISSLKQKKNKEREYTKERSTDEKLSYLKDDNEKINKSEILENNSSFSYIRDKHILPSIKEHIHPSQSNTKDSKNKQIINSGLPFSYYSPQKVRKYSLHNQSPQRTNYLKNSNNSTIQYEDRRNLSQAQDTNSTQISKRSQSLLQKRETQIKNKNQQNRMIRQRTISKMKEENEEYEKRVLSHQQYNLEKLNKHSPKLINEKLYSHNNSSNEINGNQEINLNQSFQKSNSITIEIKPKGSTDNRPQRNPQNLALDEQEMEELKQYIKRIDELIQQNGGINCGWDEKEHRGFLYFKKIYGDQYEKLEKLMKRDNTLIVLFGISNPEVRQHHERVENYTKLNNQKTSFQNQYQALLNRIDKTKIDIYEQQKIKKKEQEIKQFQQKIVTSETRSKLLQNQSKIISQILIRNRIQVGSRSPTAKQEVSPAERMQKEFLYQVDQLDKLRQQTNSKPISRHVLKNIQFFTPQLARKKNYSPFALNS